MTRLCGCGRSVIDAPEPAGLLDADPHPLGIWRPDGTRLTGRDVVLGEHGHQRHPTADRTCRTPQLDLFAPDPDEEAG